MNLASVMDELGAALDGIDGLRVSPYWADKITPPAAIVGWPDPLTYDSTMQRGADQVTLPVTICVGRIDARTSRDRLAAYVDGSGDSSVKATVEAASYTSCDSARVASVEFGVITVGGTEYLSATFQVDVIGKGA